MGPNSATPEFVKLLAGCLAPSDRSDSADDFNCVLHGSLAVATDQAGMAYRFGCHGVRFRGLDVYEVVPQTA
jgi:hypothetical protein